MAVTASADFSASLIDPAQRRRVSLSLYVVTGTSPTFTSNYVGDLPYIGSPTMSIDGTSNVLRTMSVDVPLAQLPPSTSSHLYAMAGPYGSELAEYAMLPGDPVALGGIKSAGGYINVAWWQYTSSAGWRSAQIAQLRIERVSLSAGGTVATLELSDWMSAVNESPFVTTYAPVSGGKTLSYYDAVYNIVRDAFPLGWVGPQGGFAGGIVRALGPDGGIGYYPKDGINFSGSRSDAIATLMASVQNQPVYINDETGRFLATADWIGTYGVPSPPSLKPPSVWTANDVALGGYLSRYDVDYREDTSYNAVSITWSSADGQTYGQAFVVDNDPTSPTYWNGPYGHHPRPNEQVDTIGEATAAIAFANYRLRTMKSQHLRGNLEMPPNPLLQPHDFITVKTVYALDPSKVVTESHLIVSLDLPLDGSNMSLVTQVRSRSVA